MEREPIALRDLVLSIKCGESDPTLGLAGNPALGRVVDWLCGPGGHGHLRRDQRAHRGRAPDRSPVRHP
ncbi:hypothetical protein [Thermus sediminis]|uniref:hypothetical protein n=1 Tax=Thermus sediminis TaxID=1761908 RepID=UPI002FCD7D22